MSHSNRPLPLVALWLSGVLALLQGSVAHAEGDVAANADALFTRGRERLAAGDFVEACPLFAESYQLDPATGSVLALALCYERAGQLASAYAAYAVAVTRAHEEGRADRERAAQDKLTQLKSQLSTLSLDLTALKDEIELSVRINDTQLTSEQLAQPLPVDGGEFVVEVLADGKQPWRASVSVAATAENVALTVPALVPLAAPKVALPPASPLVAKPVAAPLKLHHAPKGPVRRDVDDAAGRSPAEWMGIALMTTGGATLVTSVGLALRGAHLDNREKYECVAGTCSAAGEDARAQAKRMREASLLVGLTSVAVCTTGFITFVWGRYKHPHALALRARPSAWALPSGAGAAVSGAF